MKSKLPKYAWPGGYPMFYLFADGGVCCPDCANQDNDSEAHVFNDDEQWRLVTFDINYEDTNLFCDHCQNRIESAYCDE